MKNVMKGIIGFVFSFCLLFTANAQTDSLSNADTSAKGPSPDDIVCVQVSENVFECGIIEPDSMGADSSARRETPFNDRPSDNPRSSPNKNEDEDNPPVDI